MQLSILFGLRKIDIPGNPSMPTRYRWALSGILTPNGLRIKLQVWRVGRNLMTTPEAVERFILALSGDAPSYPDEEDASRHSEEADRTLASMGF